MGKRNSYTEEFKREAVARAAAVGPTKACEELGIVSSLIHTWKRKYSSETPLKSSSKPSYEELEKEVKKLKKELGYMDEINKVLKKSTAIFSSDQIKK
jgi:transposase-like protein